MHGLNYQPVDVRSPRALEGRCLRGFAAVEPSVLAEDMQARALQVVLADHLCNNRRNHHRALVTMDSDGVRILP